MPIFSQEKKESKKRGRVAKGIPQEIINEYKEFISKLEKKSVGTLSFKKGENINLARKALIQASVELKKYVRVRKPRGTASVLSFEHISRKEFVAALKVAAERGKKLKGVPKKRKAKAKAKAKKA